MFGHFINDTEFFLRHMKLAVLTIVIATLSILVMSIMFVSDERNDYAELPDPEKAE